jgi:CIC family chloride channel protein
MAKQYLTAQAKNWSQQISILLDRHKVPEYSVVLLTAILVGIGAGLGAVVFRRLIQGVFDLAYGGLGGLLKGIGPIHLLIIPAVGGAIYGPMIYRFAREAKGHGVPEVMEAVALRGGRIRPRVAVVKSLASAICIGTGGSVGREGPIAQIGSALGSTIGQLFNLSDERIKNLVACGAAGGIAATFNAPIAGSIFALEVILGQFHAAYFGAVVISAVIADVVAHLFDKDVRAFVVPEYSLVSPWELLLYVGLGILAALFAVLFTRSLYFSEDLWEKLKFPEYFKPILGGLLLGVVGILSPKILGYPRVFGVGYESITEALSGGFELQITVALLVLKLLATIITLGAGGSGGIFAPSLFMGAMLGESFGQIAHQIFPAITAPPGAYALVGMAAFFSGAAFAPVTAILILFEMTGDYQIILPLMLATVLSTLIARAISRESIYTLKLSRRGVHLDQGQDIDILQGVTVGEIMTTDVDTVNMNMTLDELAQEFDQSLHHGFPVVDDSDQLAGVVSIQDLRRVISQGKLEEKTIGDIATTKDLLVAYPDEPMGVALRRLATRDVSRLPVLKSKDSREIVGVIRRSDIVRAYDVAATKRAQHQHRVEVLRLRDLDGSSFMHVELPPGAQTIGKRIDEIELPEDSLVVSVRQGRKLRVAHGYTVLGQNDRLTVFASQACAPEVLRILTNTESEPEGEQDVEDSTQMVDENQS